MKTLNEWWTSCCTGIQMFNSSISARGNDDLHWHSLILPSCLYCSETRTVSARLVLNTRIPMRLFTVELANSCRRVLECSSVFHSVHVMWTRQQLQLTGGRDGSDWGRASQPPAPFAIELVASPTPQHAGCVAASLPCPLDPTSASATVANDDDDAMCRRSDASSGRRCSR